MLDANVWKRISQPVDADGADLVIPINITRGHGFFLTSIGDNELVTTFISTQSSLLCFRIVI